MAEPTFDPAKVTIKDMKAFCRIYEALQDKEKSSTPLGELCKAEGVDKEFLSSLQIKLFGGVRDDMDDGGRLVRAYGKKGVTDTGERIYQAFRESLDPIEQLEEEGLVGADRIRIQATRSVINSAVRMAYDEFRVSKGKNRAARRAEVIITDGYSHENKAAVHQGRCDFGVGYKVPFKEFFKEVKSTVLLTTEMVLICRADSPNRSVSHLLRTYEILALPETSVFSRPQLKLLRRNQRVRPAVMLPGLVYATEWVSQDMGVAFALKAFVTKEFKERHNLATVSLKGMVPDVTVELYTRQDRIETDSRKQFLDCLVKAFKTLEEAAEL